MAEKANAADEARRISALRMAEFFGAWGSTPGNTIVAGLNTLKNKVPDIINDQKEATKISRQIDKDIYEIEKIERLEKAGNYDEAAKRKAELGKNALTKYGYDVKAYSDAQQTSAYLKAAQIRGAGGSGAGGGGEDRALNNLIGKRTDIEKAITTKQKEMSSIVRIANRPDSKDPEVQAKIVDARAKVRAATSSLQDQLNQVNGLINTYLFNYYYRNEEYHTLSLLFDNEKINNTLVIKQKYPSLLDIIINSKEFLGVTPMDGNVLLTLKISHRWSDDINKIINGTYSETSTEYKREITKYRETCKP
jgi:hypothetical protein